MAAADLFLTDFPKSGGSQFDRFFFVCLLRDYSAIYLSILMILFLFDSVYFRGGPIIIRSGSDDGTLRNRGRLSKVAEIHRLKSYHSGVCLVALFNSEGFELT